MSRTGTTGLRTALAALALLATTPGCDEQDCPDNEEFLVDMNGTCTASPRGFWLKSEHCRVSITDSSPADSGLPLHGAMSQAKKPLRQGDFILYGPVGEASFRLCRARRVAFELQLACFDGTGAPVCDAVLTEPVP